MPSEIPRVVIVGAGFGGLNAAKALTGKPVTVLVIDRYNYHLFQPLLYQVATAGLEAEEIAYPVRRILGRAPNVEFRMAQVQAVDLARRLLQTDTGPVPYDYLILAAGSESNFFGNDSIARLAHGLKDLPQADALRNHVLSCLERAAPLPPSSPERRALLTFVIAGGGPTGVELAGALAELMHLVLTHDYRSIAAREVRLLLLEGGPSLLTAFNPSLRSAALKELQRRGVEVRLDRRIVDYNGEELTVDDGSRLTARTLIWAAGVRASTLAETTGLKLARGSRLPVTGTLQLEGHPEVFVIGDMAHLEQGGHPLPQLAPVAIQQARTAARNILAVIHGRRLHRFRYWDKGTLATIGRNAAVAQFGPIGLHGFVAWVLWLTVHIMLLIGFRNRLIVLLDWACNYFTYERAVRLITERR